MLAEHPARRRGQPDDNVGSLKALQKVGFAITGTEVSLANGRNAEIEETILRLDELADTAPAEAPSA